MAFNTLDYGQIRPGPFDGKTLCLFKIHDFQKKLEVKIINQENCEGSKLQKAN